MGNRYAPISRPTQRELRERLAESASQAPSGYRGKVRGVTRNTEEAEAIEHRLEREGEPLGAPLLVSGDNPESKQARIEIAQRIGSKDPERDERYV